MPDLIYDYYGFPAHTYELTYPAPGQPQLAQEVAQLLNADGLQARVDAERGVDHGMFIPLKLMLPAADIQVIQLGAEVRRCIQSGSCRPPFQPFVSVDSRIALEELHHDY